MPDCRDGTRCKSIGVEIAGNYVCRAMGNRASGLLQDRGGTSKMTLAETIREALKAEKAERRASKRLEQALWFRSSSTFGIEEKIAESKLAAKDEADAALEAKINEMIDARIKAATDAG